jgi:hypothetical protein
MENPIAYAINKIKFAIPRQILEKTFISSGRHRYRESRSIDSFIREHIIDNRVAADIELLGSTFIQLPIKSSWLSNQGNGEYLIRVPMSATQGRVITRVTSVELGQGNTGGLSTYASLNSNAALSGAKKVLDSVMPTPITGTPFVELLDNNVIYVTDILFSSFNLFVNCYLSADENFNNLPKPAWIAFAKLCELACKAHIWTELSVTIDRAQLDGGQELGKFAEIVDNYSDAMEQYEEFFTERWKKISIMADPKSKERHLRALIGKM